MVWAGLEYMIPEMLLDLQDYLNTTNAAAGRFNQQASFCDLPLELAQRLEH